MRIVFAMLAGGLMLGAIAMGTGAQGIFAFLNAPSLMLVGGLTAALALAYHGPKDLMAAIAAGLGSGSLSMEEARAHAAALATIRVLAAGSGCVGTLIGLVKMLQNLDDPSAIGPAMAIALLCALYGLMLAELLAAPLINRIDARAGRTADDRPLRAGPSAAPVTTLLVILVAFGMMRLSLG